NLGSFAFGTPPFIAFLNLKCLIERCEIAQRTVAPELFGRVRGGLHLFDSGFGRRVCMPYVRAAPAETLIGCRAVNILIALSFFGFLKGIIGNGYTTQISQILA